MSTPEDPAPSEPAATRLTSRQARDVSAAVLIGIGLLGLGVTAYVWSTLAGAAYTFVVLAAVGVVLGLDR